MIGPLLDDGGAPGALQDLRSASSGSGDCELQLQNDGDVAYTEDGVVDSGDDWILPANTTIAAFYEVKVDVTAGSMSAGTTGSWLALSTTRSWSKGAGTGTVTFTISFREAASGAVVKTQTGLTLAA